MELSENGASYGTINTAKAAVTFIMIKPFATESKLDNKNLRMDYIEFKNGLYRLKST